MQKSLSKIRFALFSLGCLAVAIAGCSKGPKLVPVSGKVMLGNAPLTTGIISFLPDAEKGNTSKLGPSGKIESDGSYTLTTDGKSGAPLGHYKVTITTQMPGGMGAPSTVPSTPQDPSKALSGGSSGPKVNPQFSDPTKTPLRVEVVATPESGNYDLKVTP